MSDKSKQTGNSPSGPGDAPRRPFATIDVSATEVGRDGGQNPGSGEAQAAPRGEEAARAALPPPGLRSRGGWEAWSAAVLGAWPPLWKRGLKLARSGSFLSHLAAGVAGAALTLAVGALLGLPAGRNLDASPELARRLAAVEKAQAQQVSGQPADLASKLAAADKRIAGLEQQGKAIAALTSEQARLAAEAKALQGRAAGPEITERIAKLEAALAGLPAGEKSAGPSADQLAARMADMEKMSSEAGEAKAAAVRAARDVAALKSDVAGLRQGLDALKGSVDDRVLTKLASYERDLQAVLRTESERVTGTQRMLIALEIANLKRALDRGDSYARELEAVRKLAPGIVELGALDRSSAAGVPTLSALSREFRQVANAAIDAETGQADASVLDRLMAGARSVVRLRKASHEAGDESVEATLSRMEHALKDGNLGEVLAQGKQLPPKAAVAAQDWLRKVEARTAADRAVAEIEASLKATLAEQRLPGAEPKQ